MIRLLIHWALSATALIIVSKLVPGFTVDNIPAALVAALVIGLVNATLGLVLKIVTLPLTILTLGLFWFVINALMIETAAHLVGGLHVASFGAAFLGGVVLTVINFLLRHLVERKVT